MIRLGTHLFLECSAKFNHDYFRRTVVPHGQKGGSDSGGGVTLQPPVTPAPTSVLMGTRRVPKGCCPRSAKRLGQSDLAAVCVTAKVEVYAGCVGFLVNLGRVSKQHFETIVRNI